MAEDRDNEVPASPSGPREDGSETPAGDQAPKPDTPEDRDALPESDGDAPTDANRPDDGGNPPEPSEPSEPSDQAPAEPPDEGEEPEGGEGEPEEEDYDYGHDEEDYGAYGEEGEYQGYGEDYEDYDYDEGYDEGEEDDEDYGDEEEYEEDEDEEEAEEAKEEDGQVKMTLVEHLEELRKRIIRAMLGLAVGMVITLIFGKLIFAAIEAPYITAMGRAANLKTMGWPDALLMYLRICLYCGIVIASPWIFYQLWMFISAGLYKHERKYVLVAVPFCAGLFVTGAVFFLTVVCHRILGFFIWFNDYLNLEVLITFKNHVSFVTNMMLVFGLCFQTPVAVLLLAKMGLVTVKTLNHYRRHVIVGILIIAALSTSPSPVDQIALAVPMWMLYELGVVLAYFLVEKKRRQEEEAQAAG